MSLQADLADALRDYLSFHDEQVRAEDNLDECNCILCEHARALLARVAESTP